VIAASHLDLKLLVAEGRFREDLFHRLDLYRVHLPPLRERGEGIVNIAELLIERLCRRHRLPRKKITSRGRGKMVGYPWPGNVRELAHELERGIVFEDNSELLFEHLESSQGDPAKGDRQDWFNAGFKFPADGFSLEEAIGRLIQHALQQTGNNVSAAARLLG